MDAEAERQPLRAIRVTRAARTPNANGLNTLAKLATISFEGVERELQAKIARLEAHRGRHRPPLMALRWASAYLIPKNG